MSDLNRLKLRRGNLKRQLTNFSNFLQVAASDDYDEICSRLNNIERLLGVFEELHVDIVLLESNPDHEGYRDEFEANYYSTLRKARKFIKTHAPSPSRTGDESGSDARSAENTNTNVRLPKIDLPLFSGAYDTWLCFYDSFKSMVHNKTNISNIEKLHYLRSCLRGEATTVIQSLETSEDNYEIAWSLLIERYDNKRIIVQNHLKALLEQPACSRESATNVRQLLNNINTHTRALKVLGLAVDTWDAMLIYCMTAKLDKITHQEWENSIAGKELPTLKQFIEFLTRRCQILESTSSAKYEITSSHNNTNNKSKQQQKNLPTAATKSVLTVTRNKEYCNLCKGAHKIFNCEKFLKMSELERLESAKREKLCFNCLRKNHSTDKCICGPCKKCGKKHNTLLHLNNQIVNDPQLSITVNHLQSTCASQVLIATAQIAFLDNNNKKQTARVLLDSGAQVHLMTEKFANLLQLKSTKTNIPIRALNQLETHIKREVSTKIYSMRGNYEAHASFLVVPTITAPLPSQQIDTRELNIPRNLPLADPSFYKSLDIDALIGAEIYHRIFCVGHININNQLAVLQKTKFGWIIAGRINTHNPSVTNLSCNLTLNTLNRQISKFWELEEAPDTTFLSIEEAKVEQHFLDNVTRNSQGRYSVKLPFNEKLNQLGDSYTIALKRFYSLERKLNRNSELRQQYIEFMKEYETLNHMSKVDVSNNSNENGYFLPHHAVIKETSATTKVRVVFDGSARSSTGISLNDTLRVGPTIQDDVFSILLRFRVHNYVLVADIEKMYRQVLIHEHDRRFQKILWRENQTDPLNTYMLNTVTYGTTSAPFLAVRTLHKLADDEKYNYPLAAKIVKRDFYVDDLITGSDSYANTLKLRDEIRNLLQLGGFKLRQWSSNDLGLIESLPSELTNCDLFKDPNKSIKTLGIQWNSQRDHLLYSSSNNEHLQERVTKRLILSRIAQIFDPIGLLGPIIVKAKLIMQQLWQEKIDWDESVPQGIHTQWINYRNQLHLLDKIGFERQIFIRDPVDIQLHGFCDASESAYGASIYMRSLDKYNNCISRLVCSRTKVAPLNSRLTIPKLELCAALLLAKLYKAVVSTLPTPLNEAFFWSDSTIALNWINRQPSELKTFVANRVSEIRTITNHSQWYHVPTRENPADSISRGQTILEFINNKLWKTGPEWLCRRREEWPYLSIQKIPVPEIRKPIVLTITLTDASILNRFSSIVKLTRVVAFCLRFANNCSKRDKLTGNLSTNELDHAHTCIIKLVQNQAFSREVDELTKDKAVNKKSSLRLLNPFLDKNNIIRVGGRLEHANLTYDKKHPILLPKNNHITQLIIRWYHETSLHSGIQNTLYQIRGRCWPLDGKNATKHIVHSCIKCYRFKHTENNYIMGNLPKNRLIQSRPFLNTGIDYCGPFLIKEKKHRNRNKIKVYVAIFICFATKAVHLELVSDLTTDAFISSLKRFFSRRGKSKNIYSDNGTNFVGANNELQKLYTLTNSKEFNNAISTKLSTDGINWHFIPPRSPHFGGLWETAVRSFKNHFLRTVGNTLLTFEELNTHVIEIEAILNSRPLTPLSPDPNDLIPLTPGHFLINDSLMSIPDVDFSETPCNRLSNWQHLQQLKQHFWKRWHKEYLNQLNTRSKWAHQAPDQTVIGSMVLLKEDNLPPLHWSTGRIIDLHPGDDGIVRVVSVKTLSGVYKRSIRKIAILPIETLANSS